MTIEVKVKTIGQLQSGDKKDGSGKWYAREVVLEANDGSMYPDEFVVRISGDSAENCTLKEGGAYGAEICFSTREYNGRKFQDVYLRNIKALSATADDDRPF